MQIVYHIPSADAIVMMEIQQNHANDTSKTNHWGNFTHTKPEDIPMNTSNQHNLGKISYTSNPLRLPIHAVFTYH